VRLDIRALSIPDVKLIKGPRFLDLRGYFSETFARADFAAHGIPCDFIQDNQSSSARRGTVRGLHFQREPFAQTKLVRVLQGKIFDVAVDLRRSSPSYGQHVAVELSDADDEQLLVPAGFAHGFCTLMPQTIVFYKVDKVYSAEHDGGINWLDPKLGIPWPIAAEDATVSEKDRQLPRLEALSSVFA
jgi:dTDP-4-dehydrorhamnose 3,5-epimerase